MNYWKKRAILFIGLFSLVTNVSLGASDIKKLRRLVARLQMEVMELKEKASDSAGNQMAILEPQNEKIEKLTKENLDLSQKLKDVELKFLLLEEKLEKFKKESATEKLSELNQLTTILTLLSVGEISSIEPLVLELINQGNNLNQDLLILLLAETQKTQGFVEQSLSYYVLLVSEYPKSRYLNRAIFEASELLGEMGHTEDQKNMLEALKDNEGTYGILARKKLGIEEPVKVEEKIPDTKQEQIDSEINDQTQSDAEQEGGVAEIEKEISDEKQNQADDENVNQQQLSNEQNQIDTETDQIIETNDQNLIDTETVEEEEDEEDEEDDY